MLPLFSTANLGYEIERKQLKKPDPFSVVVRQSFENLRKRQKTILSLLVLLLVLGFGIAIMLTQKAAREARGKDALFQARLNLEKELNTLVEAESSSQAEVPAVQKISSRANEPSKQTDRLKIIYKKLDVKKYFTQSVKSLEEVITNYSDTRAALDAMLILGDLYFEHGESEKAEPHYQAAADSISAPLEKALVLLALGYTYENSKKLKEALDVFQRAFNLGQEGLKGELWLAMARVHEAQGQKDKAKEIYQKIISQIPNTEYANTAESQQASLE